MIHNIWNNPYYENRWMYAFDIFCIIVACIFLAILLPIVGVMWIMEHLRKSSNITIQRGGHNIVR